MASDRVSKRYDEQIGGGVEHKRRLREVWGGIDISFELDDLFDPVKIA